MKSLFKYKGETFPVEFQKVGAELWFTFQGQTFVRPFRESLKKTKSHSETEASGEIFAPMPGKITKILRAVGEAVEKGDSIVVMEAMKMEYTLKSETKGKIESLNCTVGEQVVLGKLLVKVV